MTCRSKRGTELDVIVSVGFLAGLTAGLAALWGWLAWYWRGCR